MARTRIDSPRGMFFQTRMMLLAFAFLVWMNPSGHATVKILSPEEQIRSFGIDPTNLAEVREALESEDPGIRLCAAQYLATIEGEDISAMLNDKKQWVRTETARLLLDQDSGAGLSRMIEDYQSLVPAGMDRDAESFAKALRRPGGYMDMRTALEVGEVLALYGDLRALRLAELALEHTESSVARDRAINVLVAVLSREGEAATDADSIRAKQALAACGARETRPTVMYPLIGRLKSLGNEYALEILAGIEQQSPVPAFRGTAGGARQDLLNPPPEGGSVRPLAK